LSILEEAVHIAKKGRLQILDTMNACISAPRTELSQYAPRIETTKIPPDRIGELIGPGGKNIKGIQAESGAKIDIEDDGTVHVYAVKKESLDIAMRMIKMMFAEAEVGALYTGRVVSTTNFGAFMELFPGRDGLIHISELADFRVNQTEDVVKVGDIVTAKCVGVDDKGRVKMSRKAVLKDRERELGGGDIPGETLSGDGPGDGGERRGEGDDRGERRDRGDRGDRRGPPRGPRRG
jgi:polyribonucleotide nucleotidyltransferase